jgi:hypothetical protein
MFYNDTTVKVNDRFTVPGTYYWTCPVGVSKVTTLCIGGGGYSSSTSSGVGGGIGWKTNIPVVPGTQYLVKVGKGGTTANNSNTPGETSFFISPYFVAGNGGGTYQTGYGGVGDGGGDGIYVRTWNGSSGYGSPSTDSSSNYGVGAVRIVSGIPLDLSFNGYLFWL